MLTLLISTFLPNSGGNLVCLTNLASMLVVMAAAEAKEPSCAVFQRHR